MIELLELKFSRRWQTNKIESDWSNSPRHSFSRQFRSPRKYIVLPAVFSVLSDQRQVLIISYTGVYLTVKLFALSSVDLGPDMFGFPGF